MPLLVTPPFPEHPSGHSACSMASAIILEYLFGSAFEFTDNSLEGYNINARTFKSFRAAALEVSESRVLGGIHYRSGTESGTKLGAYIAEKLIGKLQKR
jgi:membrane-associated phospholipid phosphatase